MRLCHFLRPTAPLLLTLLAISTLHADVTVRYKREVTVNPSLPAELMQSMKSSMDATMQRETSLQFKGGKAITSLGTYTSICDYPKHEITILDKDGKRYATMPLSQLDDAMAAAMPETPAKEKAAAAEMKTHFESKITGRTETIQGVAGEERLAILTVDGPRIPNQAPAPMMRMVMHYWTAKASEVMRVPAVREWAGYNLFSVATMNPMASMEKTLQKMPGLADGIADMVKSMQSGGTMVTLRIQIEMFMPMVGMLTKQLPAGSNPYGAGFGPDTPLVQMNQELGEITTTPIADSVFQVPQDYTAVPAAELVKDMLRQFQPAAK